MKNVKRVFFLTEEEAKQQRSITGNRLIDWSMPHYELEDGTIVYALHNFGGDVNIRYTDGI